MKDEDEGLCQRLPPKRRIVNSVASGGLKLGPLRGRYWERFHIP